MNPPYFFFQREPVPSIQLGRFQAKGKDALALLGDVGATPTTPIITIRQKVFDHLFIQGVEL